MRHSAFTRMIVPAALLLALVLAFPPAARAVRLKELDGSL